MSAPRIAIAGAGNIGCFVGGMLLDCGFDVRFLARARVVETLTHHGLHLTDFDRLNLQLVDVQASADPAAMLAGADVVLVCVKSADTDTIAGLIARHAPSAQVISLQNGVANAGILRGVLSGADVRAGTVPFNVVMPGPGHYHRATSGDILVEAGPMPDLSHPKQLWVPVDNIEAVQWGKLLINLGNAVNALSDIPLLAQLHNRAWRRLLADQMTEALRVLHVAGITPARTTAAPARLLPAILRLPTPVFRLVASSLLTIDAEARSSMWEDLKLGRKTEIDALQGSILHLADHFGRQAPLNARMRLLIRAAEEAGNGPPGLTVSDIRG